MLLIYGLYSSNNKLGPTNMALMASKTSSSETQKVSLAYRTLMHEPSKYGDAKVVV